MSDREDSPTPSTEKLRLLKSPLVSGDGSHDQLPQTEDPNISTLGDRIAPFNDTPAFQKHEDASTLELFFDLLFAANYTVFSQTQEVSSHERFEAYVGYFTLLWMTWLAVGLYDVRFVTDSIFQRLAKAIHIGVMVGFSVVAPNFLPSNQVQRTMQTMSVILAVSRFTLALEYGAILWHVRRFKKTHLAIGLQIGLCLIAAFIYLGITFRFEKHNTKVFVTWYIVSVGEIILTFLISNFFKVLSFTKTHLMRRMSLLTVLILGDAVIVIATDVVTIVTAANTWNSLTIGTVAAAVATVYTIFLVYFDWFRHDHLPAIRQQIWVCLHFPLHLASVLFLQGFTQFLLWAKIGDVLAQFQKDPVVTQITVDSDTTSKEVSQIWTANINDFFVSYPPKFYDVYQAAYLAVDNITQLPDNFWPKMSNYLYTLDPADAPQQEQIDYYFEAYNTITNSMLNAMFSVFKIDLQARDEIEEDLGDSTVDAGTLQESLLEETVNRYRLVFSYGYVAGGLTLLLMTMLLIVSRLSPWKKWPIIRVCVNLALAIGTSLTALLYYNNNASFEFLFSPWVIPVLTFVWIAVLAMTHIHGRAPVFFFPKSANPFFGRGSKAGWGAGTPQEVPMQGYEGLKGQPHQMVQETPMHYMSSQPSFYGQTAYDGSGYMNPPMQATYGSPPMGPDAQQFGYTGYQSPDHIQRKPLQGQEQ